MFGATLTGACRRSGFCSFFWGCCCWATSCAGPSPRRYKRWRWWAKFGSRACLPPSATRFITWCSCPPSAATSAHSGCRRCGGTSSTYARGKCLSANLHAYACEGQAPHPFELCLDIQVNNRTFNMYSRREWRAHGEAALDNTFVESLVQEAANLNLNVPAPEVVSSYAEGEPATLPR